MDSPSTHLSSDGKRLPPALALTPSAKRVCLDPKPELHLSVDLFHEPHASPFAGALSDPDSDLPISPADITHGPPPFSPPVNADKFTKSRAVGQVHRDNEKVHVDALRRDVNLCRDNNTLLFALFAVEYRMDRAERAFPLRQAAQIHMVGPNDRPEDADISTEEEALEHGMYPLSPVAAAKAGQRFMSPAVAAVLMEMLVYRRNIIVPSCDPNRRKRRRGSFRFATTETQARESCDFALDLFGRQASDAGMPEEHRAAYVDRMMGAVSCALESWSRDEAVSNPLSFDNEDEDEERFPPGSPTRPQGAEFGSPARRRGEGAKRCSRCGTVKVSGSGHGRSKCDDGHSISSLVPYPASPRSEGHQSS